MTSEVVWRPPWPRRPSWPQRSLETICTCIVWKDWISGLKNPDFFGSRGTWTWIAFLLGDWRTVAPGLDCQSIPHSGQPKGPFSALSAENVGRKSFCIEIPFLPFCRKTLFWQKGSISAETGSFCRCSYNFLDLIVDLDWTDRS